MNYVDSILHRSKKEISVLIEEFLSHRGPLTNKTSLLELVLFIEDTFGFAVPDEDIDQKVFPNHDKITAYVKHNIHNQK